MAILQAGHKALRDLATALGLDGRAVKRIVVDVAVNDVVKVYVQGYGSASDVKAVANLLSGPDVQPVVETVRQVGVDEAGFVMWEKA